MVANSCSLILGEVLRMVSRVTSQLRQMVQTDSFNSTSVKRGTDIAQQLQ